MPSRIDRWIEPLAGEYALGTLRGAARRRLRRLMDARADLRAAVQRWEERLQPLVHEVPRVQPSPAVWTAIRRRIRALPPHTDSAVTPGAWTPARGWATAAAVVLVVTGLMWATLFRATGLADVPAADGAVAWRVATNPGHDRLYVRAVRPEPHAVDRDFELWALPDGGAPISLGLLPGDGETRRPLSGRQRVALAVASRIAVSLEPRGGSPSGAPTGPIVHVVAIRRAG